VRDPGTVRHPGVEEPPAMVPDPQDRREPDYGPEERDPEPVDAMADDRWEVDEPFSGSFGAYRS